jgi:hypothetical protein
MLPLHQRDVLRYKCDSCIKSVIEDRLDDKIVFLTKAVLDKSGLHIKLHGENGHLFKDIQCNVNVTVEDILLVKCYVILRCLIQCMVRLHIRCIHGPVQVK